MVFEKGGELVFWLDFCKNAATADPKNAVSLADKAVEALRERIPAERRGATDIVWGPPDPGSTELHEVPAPETHETILQTGGTK